MKPHPPVSVVVPTLNSGRTIEACLTSIRNQTNVDVEIIVVDNSSTDGTDRIAEAIADSVITAGPERSAQRNIGWRAARSPHIAFIDSDMKLEPAVLSDALQSFDKAGVGAVVVPEVAFGEGFFANCRRLEKELYLNDPSVEAARVFSVESLLRVAGYDETLTGTEDWDLADRVSRAGYATSRTTARIWHDEGHVSLKAQFKKKQYYGSGIVDYHKRSGDSQARRVVRPSVLQPDKLLREPLLGLGLLTLKVVEVSGLATGVLKGRVRTRRR